MKLSELRGHALSGDRSSLCIRSSLCRTRIYLSSICTLMCYCG